jgi:D-sedoheptulose 7-phosphate isomerase
MNKIKQAIETHLQVIEAMIPMVDAIGDIAERMQSCIQNGGRIFWMGNGGSAADSQHLAAEMVGRFERERRALPSIALTTDTSILTAVGNDYGFESIFSRQIEALCCQRDVVVGLSTSGNSPNVLAAIQTAKAIGAYAIGFAGKDGGRLAKEADRCLIVPSNNTARIQEAHILIGHILCDRVESAFASSNSGN